jgi:hypothetical protein
MIYTPSLLLLLLASVQAKVPSTDLNLEDLDTNGIEALTVQGATNFDKLGSSVSGAGDVNGDGFDDVIVGAPDASPNGRSYAGTVYVMFGKASGFGTVDMSGFNSSDFTGFIIQGAASWDHLGYWADSVSGAGNVNNDGFDDVIVGAWGADPNSRDSAGAAYVFFGKAAGFVTIDLLTYTFSASTGFVINGAVAGDKLGSASGAGMY